MENRVAQLSIKSFWMSIFLAAGVLVSITPLHFQICLPFIPPPLKMTTKNEKRIIKVCMSIWRTGVGCILAIHFFLITVIWNRDRQQEIQIVYKSAIQRFMFEFDPWSFQRGWGRICISYYRSSSLVTWFKIFFSQKCQ